MSFEDFQIFDDETRLIFNLYLKDYWKLERNADFSFYMSSILMDNVNPRLPNTAQVSIYLSYYLSINSRPWVTHTTSARRQEGEGFESRL